MLCIPGDGKVSTSPIWLVFLSLDFLVNKLVEAVFKDSQRDLGHCLFSSFFCYYFVVLFVKKQTSNHYEKLRKYR